MNYFCGICNACKTCCACVSCTLCKIFVVKDELCQSEEICKASSHHLHCCVTSAKVLSTTRVGRRNIDHVGREDERSFVTRPLTFHVGAATPRLQSKRFASLELEFNSLGDLTKLPEINELTVRWLCTTAFDGSMPNRDQSFEINLSPATGMALQNQLMQFFTALRAGQAEIVPECGLHTHVDARDYSDGNVVNFLNLYQAVEGGLFSLLPSARRWSDYCRPCSTTFAAMTRQHHSYHGNETIRNADTEEEERTFIAFKRRASIGLYGEYDMASYARTKGYGEYGQRRNALNLHSYYHRGTMEFRHHHATLNEHEVLGWVSLVQTLVDYGRTATASEIADLSPNPVYALYEVAERAADPFLCDYIEKRLEDYFPNWETIWSDWVESAQTKAGKPRVRPPHPAWWRLGEPEQLTAREDRIRFQGPRPPRRTATGRLRTTRADEVTNIERQRLPRPPLIVDDDDDLNGD